MEPSVPVPASHCPGPFGKNVATLATQPYHCTAVEERAVVRPDDTLFPAGASFEKRVTLSIVETGKVHACEIVVFNNDPALDSREKLLETLS